MLKTRKLSFHIDRKALIDNVNLELEPGKFYGILGPNGAGKSTLLRLLSGELTPTYGDVFLAGLNLNTFSLVELAKRRSFLHQKREVNFPFTGREIVEMGRFPYQKMANEEELIEHFLRKVSATTLGDRIYNTLSGGEACRIDLARVLAQETDIIMLDEPTNHLDPKYQIEVAKLCFELSQNKKIVLAALHDLNLAIQHTDELIILMDGELISKGPAKEIINREILSEVYQADFEILTNSEGKMFVFPKAETMAS